MPKKQKKAKNFPKGGGKIESNTLDYSYLTRAEKNELLLEKYAIRDELLKQETEFEHRLNKLNKNIQSIEEKNKILYFGHPDKQYLGPLGKWAPNPLQQKVFKAFENPAKKIIVMAGGNQIGKTLAESCIIMATDRD